MARSIRRDLLLSWSLLPFLTPARKRLLLRRFVPPETIGAATVAEVRELLSIPLRDAAIVKDPSTLPSLVRQRDAAREATIVLGDPDYPPRLAEIADPPLALFAWGDRALASRPAIAIVGSRRASPYGVNAARTLARDLARAGVVVVSGLARGIDGAAHLAALEQQGPTIAVLGTGIDVVYPPEHRPLRDRITASGLLLSELPAGTTPQRAHFPVRNRIIAGLALGVIVVEAGERSGSLITARLANEEGREVFAVPGSIFSPGSAGAHRLIQDGAKLVHTVDDVFAEIEEIRRADRGTAEPSVDADLAPILELFDPAEPVGLEAAAARLGVAVQRLAPAVLRLELLGRLRALPGMRWIRKVG